MNEDDGSKLNGRFAGVVLAILGAFGGGFGSNYIWVRANPDALTQVVRPDPFTGNDGRELERQIDNVASGLRELNNRVNRMSPEEVSRRISVLEHEVNELKEDVRKHIHVNGSAPKGNSQ